MGRVLAFDIGGSFVKAGVVNLAGEIIKKIERAVPLSYEQADEFFAILAGELLEDQPKEILGIGLGAPGAIDRQALAISGHAANLSQLVGLDFGKVFEGFSSNVLIDNDANNAARGEKRWGAARGSANALVVTLGTGIGSGLIIDHRLVLGAGGYAGEFGHTIIEPYGRRCTCGGQGCIEAYASAWALREQAEDLARRHPESLLARIKDRRIEPKEISQAADQGDDWANRLLSDAGRLLGLALASTANLLNLEVIVIGGGLAAAGERLFAPLKENFELRALPQTRADCRILPAKLGSLAGLLGAASLVMPDA